MTCADCIHKNRRLERSRNYICVDFKRRETTDENN